MIEFSKIVIQFFALKVSQFIYYIHIQLALSGAPSVSDNYIDIGFAWIAAVQRQKSMQNRLFSSLGLEKFTPSCFNGGAGGNALKIP